MKDRILQFLKDKSLSATRFADEIGVQRSSISHILSGRNKPSLDFIEKVLNTYKDMSAEWFLRGKGSIYSNISTSNSVKDKATPNLFNSPKENAINNNQNVDNQSKNTEFTNVNNSMPNTGIEKIIIFYKNKSFEVYQNSM